MRARAAVLAVVVAAAASVGVPAPPARAHGQAVATYVVAGSGSPAVRAYHSMERHPYFTLQLHWAQDSDTSVKVDTQYPPEVTFPLGYLWVYWHYKDGSYSPSMRADQLLRNGHDFYVPFSAQGVAFWADAGVGTVRVELSRASA